MSQYRANLCHTTWTGPHTMFGLSVGLPSARRFARQRHLAAIPASMQASEEPTAEAPTVLAASGACQRSAIMCTQRYSISAVCGYSSWSIMFLLTDSAIRPAPRVPPTSGRTWPGSAARCRRASARPPPAGTHPSGTVSSGGNRYFGDRPGQVPIGEHAVLHLLTDGLALVQWHGRHLLDGERSRCRYPPDDRCATHRALRGRGRAGDFDGGRTLWRRHHPLWGI